MIKRQRMGFVAFGPTEGRNRPGLLDKGSALLWPANLRSARLLDKEHEVEVANSQHSSCQDSPVMFGVAGSNPRNSMMRRRLDSVGRFWFFSHFSIAVSVIPSPSSLASCVMDRERAIRFLRRCSPRVV